MFALCQRIRGHRKNRQSDEKRERHTLYRCEEGYKKRLLPHDLLVGIQSEIHRPERHKPRFRRLLRAERHCQIIQKRQQTAQRKKHQDNDKRSLYDIISGCFFLYHS